MSVLQNELHSRVEGLGHHAEPDEYGAFVDRLSGDDVYRRRCRRHREQFIRRYPDLEDWFGEPLVVRAGREFGAPNRTYVSAVNAHARGYLLFLGLTGCLALDWDWLLAVGQLCVHKYAAAIGGAAEASFVAFEQERVSLGFRPKPRGSDWALTRVLLHRGDPDIDSITGDVIEGLEDAIVAFQARPDVSVFLGPEARQRRTLRGWRTNLHQLRVVLYHRGQLPELHRSEWPVWRVEPALPPAMSATIERYLTAKRLTDRPGTLVHVASGLRRFGGWLARTEPAMRTFASVSRDHLLAYGGWLDEYRNPRGGRTLAMRTKRWHLGVLSTFFRDSAAWEWEGMPAHRLLGAGDLPRCPKPLPRYIPEDQLNRLMQAVRELDCPYRRAAILVARWSGARRGEIARLTLDCLDSYPDGTPRLRIPAGKTKTERMVPLHPEAADAIRAVQAIRREQTDRPVPDDLTGAPARRLFVRQGQPISTTYLFANPLRIASESAGLSVVKGERITAHRFRHTVGTELAERGARLHTIMAMLGHTSVDMSLVYAQISDKEVLRDYQSVLGPGANIAGPSAEILRSGQLPASAVQWFKANFFKTELELGHCLRLPEEGPCECDLYLNCAKFVTTPAYAPRLRRRRRLERQLAEDAAGRGWEREIERHRCTAARIEKLLDDLGEALDGPEDAGALPEGIDLPATEVPG